MNLQPIGGQRHSLADQAYEAIVDALLTGVIGLGDALIMDQLAESMDISRTPVRDALLRLEHEGLVESRGRRGYLVRTIGNDDVVQLYQAREAIEGYAAGIVAAANDDAMVDRIAQTIRKAQTQLAGTVSSSLAANRAIHRSIVEAVGNQYLTASFDNVWGVSIAAVAYGHLYRPDLEEADLWAEHETLVESLRRDDAKAATAEMVRHIRAGRDVNMR